MLFLQDMLFGRLASGVVSGWRQRLLEQLLRGRNRDESSGALASRILSDLREVEYYLQFGLGSLVAESVTLLAIVSLLLLSDARATLILCLLALPIVLTLRLLGRQTERYSRQAQASLERVGARLQEYFQLKDIIVALHKLPFFFGRFGQINNDSRRQQLLRNTWVASQIPITQLLSFVALFGLLFVLMARVETAEMSLGELTAFLSLLALSSTPLQLLPRALALLQQARAAAKRLQSLGATQASPQTHLSYPLHGSSWEGVTLELKGLSFAFGRESILSDCHFSFEGPSFYAIQGESGAGKSSLLKLILGLLEPTSGDIRLNGHSLPQMAGEERAQLLSYVPQQPMLFQASIRENLCLGRGFSDEEVGGVLEQVGLAAELSALNQGLDYELGEGGKGLSGGQQQRLSLARALLLQPKVLLLDEVSSNLDDASEAHILRCLNALSENCLVISVSHRSKSIQAARTVLVLQDKRLNPVDKRNL